VKARGLCEKCNGGWMSDLESKIKPILEPLISIGPRYWIMFSSQASQYGR
jgi:protein involved in temperature-dependent protein secretion